MSSGGQHEYTSTACWHAVEDNRPELHSSCRATCKYAPGNQVEYCMCLCHAQGIRPPIMQPWVDQAREVAESLLAVINAHGIDLNVAAPKLAAQLKTPETFWIRGEAQPPGRWIPPGDR